MSLEEQALYRNLLDAIWLFDGHPIPDEPKALVSASGGDAEAWARGGAKVLRWMRKVDGGWVNDTASEVMKETKTLSKARSKAGKKGAAQRWQVDSKLDGKPITSDEASAITNDNTNTDTKLSPPSPSPSPDLSLVPEKSDRAHGRRWEPVIGRNPHIDHSACDVTLSRCVPSVMHRKFSDSLAPKYGGDRDATKAALQQWYPTVWATLPADFVMGDALKFWQAQFDAAFASPVVAPSKIRDRAAEDRAQAEAVLEIVRQSDRLVSGAR